MSRTQTARKRARSARAPAHSPPATIDRRGDARRPPFGPEANHASRSRLDKPRHGRRQKAARATLAVELAVQVMDGTRLRRTRVRIAGTAAKPPAMPDAGFPGARQREAMARQVTRGVNPAELARILAAIAHPQRLAILFKLLACEGSHQMLARVTGLKAGPLYYHLRELRAAGLIGPKVRDLYVLSPAGTRTLLAIIATGRLHSNGQYDPGFRRSR